MISKVVSLSYRLNNISNKSKYIHVDTNTNNILRVFSFKVSSLISTTAELPVVRMKYSAGRLISRSPQTILTEPCVQKLPIQYINTYHLSVCQLIYRKHCCCEYKINKYFKILIYQLKRSNLGVYTSGKPLLHMRNAKILF